MRKVCAWCKTVMEEGDGPTTHGCCEECEERYFPSEVSK